MPLSLSPRGRQVARWFGVDPARAARRPDADPHHLDRHARQIVGLLAGGRVVFIGGPSGAGKSRLLARLRRIRDPRLPWIDFDAVVPGAGLVVDVMADELAAGDGNDGNDGLERALEALAQVGLGEVWTYLRPAAQLSEGERWRLRLAIALARADRRARDGRPVILVADEFAATLDRVTARIVARNFARIVSQREHVCAIVASSHDDLAPALQADLTVQCDFGEVHHERRGGRADSVDRAGDLVAGARQRE